MALKFDISKLSGMADRLGLKNARPPLEGFYIYFLLFFIGMLVADYSTTMLRGVMIPEGAVTQSRPTGRFGGQDQVVSQFQGIKDKNIFNADHLIPDSVGEKQQGGGFEDNNDPVPTTLPLELLGTIIHSRHERSVATIKIRGKDVLAVKEEELIEGMAKVREILSYKVIFRNQRNRKLEYVELKEENAISIGVATSGSGPVAGAPEKTNFTFKRTEINKYLENLPRVLQDAKAVPYVTPGSGGEVSGFKMVAIKAGSIYEKLGLKRGDILRGVNGESIDSPQKAMEMYGALKNENQIQLEITRDGKTTTLNYSLE